MLPTIPAARRRSDEHYNIIRIGLALNEVGGARAESDKGTNKKAGCLRRARWSLFNSRPPRRNK